MSTTTENAAIERNWRPSAEHRYFIYDPDGEGFIYYRSAEDRDADSQNIIRAYLDDGWDEAVENVVAGEISHTCEKVNVRHRPPEDEIDGEGCDGEGTYWGEFDYMCNYELVAANGAPSKAAIDVLAERQRQVSAEGWTPEHDDEHACDEIAAFACVYAMPPAVRDWDASSTGYGATLGQAIAPEGWQPKYGDRRRELVKAGALIVAEIERLDRAESKAQ